jgi:replication fork protection complex subunit Tof1/Swi1
VGNAAPPPGGADAVSGSRSFVLHHQQAINRESGSIMDMGKRQKTKKGTTLDELAREDNLSMEARVILQNLAIEFVQSCFNRKLHSAYILLGYTDPGMSPTKLSFRRC